MGPESGWGPDRLCQTSPIPRSPDGDKNSERPVDALAENGKLPTHLLTTSNQEMLAHLKRVRPKKVLFKPTSFMWNAFGGFFDSYAMF